MISILRITKRVYRDIARLVNNTLKGDLSVNNQFGQISTPNIDALSRGGVNFRDGHSGSSRCGPSRYTLMTGRYVFNSEHAHKVQMNPDTPHLGTLLKGGDYDNKQNSKNPSNTMMVEQ